MTNQLSGDGDGNGGFWHELADNFKAAFLPQKYQADRQFEAMELRMAFEAEREEERQKFELLRLKLQYLQQFELQQSHYLKQYELQKDNQEFQQYLAEQRMSFEAHQTDKRLQFEEKMDEKRLFVQWLMQKDSQYFQNEQGEKQFQRSIELANLSANLSKENQLEIEKFKDECARLQF